MGKSECKMEVVKNKRRNYKETAYEINHSAKNGARWQKPRPWTSVFYFIHNVLLMTVSLKYIEKKTEHNKNTAP